MANARLESRIAAEEQARSLPPPPVLGDIVAGLLAGLGPMPAPRFRPIAPVRRPSVGRVSP